MYIYVYMYICIYEYDYDYDHRNVCNYLYTFNTVHCTFF